MTMQAQFFIRFYQYQKERFPFLTHGLLIAAFSYAAIAFARQCRGAEGFIEGQLFVARVFITITLFFLLRISDENKDAIEDAVHRPHLPVPRGLISIPELRKIGGVVIALQVAIILLVFPRMFGLYAVVLAYMALMAREFLMPEWLKARPVWYVTSHMVIIPLVDIFASGLDWHLAHQAPPLGLVVFFFVSFFNGIVLEIGRKIRTPEAEEVNTYSRQLGMQKASLLWISMLTLTAALSIYAAMYAQYELQTRIALVVMYLLCSLPAWLFLLKKTAKRAKLIEHASGIWTLCMYLLLGGVAG